MIFIVKNYDLCCRGSNIQASSVFLSHIYYWRNLLFLYICKVTKILLRFHPKIVFFTYLSENKSVFSEIIHIFVHKEKKRFMDQPTDNTVDKTGHDKITAYRARIVEAICQAQDKNGNARYNPQEAQELAEELSDEDLAFGMDYNTPEEVADLLMESGLV